MTSVRLAAAVSLVALLAAACVPGGAGTEPPFAPVPTTEAPFWPAPPAPPPSASSSAAPKDADPIVEAMAKRVSAARGLPIKKPIANRVIARDEILVRIRAHVARELPADVLAHQGEVLAALELVPAQYDFVEGVFALLEGRIAGFYEPDDGTMYLIDDLDEREAEETLAHELVHALQDQSYSLGPLLKYAPGQSDRIAAAHALAEGDAMSAMFDVMVGSAFRVSEDVLRLAFQASTAFSTSGSRTPPALQASLTSAYTDGFRFVQALRAKGGWPLVDAAWQKLPETTEQLLHPEKFEAREPALAVAPAAVDALGPGFRRVLDDVMGEQGLRISLEDWSNRRQAERAAAGWGGDRYVVARSDPPGGGRATFAIAWHVRMDTQQDAREVADVLQQKFGKRCRERPDLGPFTWRVDSADVVVVAGPYVREGRKATSAGTCSVADGWARVILASR